MSFTLKKFALWASLLVTTSFAAGQEYFDCWLENVSRLSPTERARLGVKDETSAFCGCFKAYDGGEITKVFNAPKPRVLPCPGGSCFKGGAMEQCMDNVRQTSVTLADFVDGKAMAGSIPMGFDEGWELTPFGDYYNNHADRAKDITCFINVHERPWAPKKKDASVFRISGLPKKLLPEAELRFSDYSDFRCLDKGELTGFSFNGYVENVRHVDENGLMQGEEVGYMNDPTYPSRQSDRWGKVLWTANYKNGMREGKAYFYRSSVYDHIPETMKQYYFKFLEVPYQQGFANGTAHMFSENGFVMADMPVKRGELFGRTVIHNPFKKKNVNLTFNAGNLEGFVDFGDFGGVFHQGLPNGLITFWSVKDTCYEWKPGSLVCYTDRLKKKQWGTYKMGKFQGKMECYNGLKGDVNLVCSDPVQDSINADPHEIAKKAREAADLAKINVQKAQDAVAQAEQAVNQAKSDLKRAQAAAEKAEKVAADAADSVEYVDLKCDSLLAAAKDEPEAKPEPAHKKHGKVKQPPKAKEPVSDLARCREKAAKSASETATIPAEPAPAPSAKLAPKPAEKPAPAPVPQQSADDGWDD